MGVYTFIVSSSSSKQALLLVFPTELRFVGLRKTIRRRLLTICVRVFPAVSLLTTFFAVYPVGNGTFAQWRRLTTTTRIPQFVLFSCKLVQLLFKPHWDYQILIAKEKRNEFW